MVFFIIPNQLFSDIAVVVLSLLNIVAVYLAVTGSFKVHGRIKVLSILSMLISLASLSWTLFWVVFALTFRFTF